VIWTEAQNYDLTGLISDRNKREIVTLHE